MRIYIKAENEQGEIEFMRANKGELFITLIQSHGECYHILTVEEVKALVDYIKLTDEQL